MEQSLYQIEFKSLRQAYVEVKAFIESESGEQVISLKSTIQDDLGLFGDDNWYLLNKFVIEYKLDAAQFNYEEYFISESQLSNYGMLFVYLILFPIFFPIWLFRVLFTRQRWNEIEFYPDWSNKEKETKDLSFGDMLTWYIVKKFTLRNQIKFCLI